MNVMVVPAQGGFGREMETQANTLAAEIAQRLGGHHRLLHLPDHMDEQAKQEMLRLPEIRETMERIQRADIILHGIGCAQETMSRLPVEQVQPADEEWRGRGVLRRVLRPGWAVPAEIIRRVRRFGAPDARLPHDCGRGGRQRRRKPSSLSCGMIRIRCW